MSVLVMNPMGRNRCRNLQAILAVSAPLFAALVLPQATAQGAASVTISVNGQWSFDNPATQDHTGEQRFSVLVSGARYLIAFESRRAFSPGYLIVTSDGVDTFSATNPVDWTPPDGLRPIRPKDSKARFAVGAAHPSSFPQGEGMLPAQILWLAYCFPCQSELPLSQTNGLPFNTVTGYKLAAAEEFRLELRRTNAAVAHLDFYAPGRGFDPQRGSNYEFPAPYTSGWLQSQFVASEFTTLADITLPRVVTFQDFTTKKDANSPHDVAPFGTYRISATQMTLVDELPPVFPPLSPDAKTIVNDYRLLKADGQAHGFAVGENGNFAQRDSNEFKEMQRQLHKEARRKLLASLTFYLVLGGSLVLFGWKVIRARPARGRGDGK